MKTATTARDHFADMLAGEGGLFAWALVRSGLEQRAADGIAALAALWFDQYDDETDLPPELVKVIDLFCGGADGFFLSSERLDGYLNWLANDDEED